MEKDGSTDLDVDWLAGGWLALLHNWIDEAEQAGVAEPNAMVLGTVENGRPVTRAVLCKSVDADGVTFYTNYESNKGADLAATPYASVTFPWSALGRQVHIRGAVTKVSSEETAEYWARRPAAPSWAPGRPSNPGRSPACRVAGSAGRGDGPLRRT